jgi:peroxiredoxin
MAMKKLALLLALVVVVVVAGCKRGEKPAAGSSKTTPAATATGHEVGTSMPDYSAMNLDGSKFDLASRRGKVVLLNIWATWCTPCLAEIPELQRIHDAYAARGFEVVGASVDESGVESVKQFVDAKQMRYPVVLDPQGQIANILQASVLPTSVLLDRNGKIIWKHIGYIEPNNQELDAAIKKAL